MTRAKLHSYRTEILALFFSAFFSTATLADYHRVGPVTGTVCKGLGVEVCDMGVELHAVKDGDQFYTIREVWRDVDEYNARRGLCHVSVKSKGLGLLSNGINLLSPGKKFYTVDGEAVRPDSIRFKCVKR